MNDLINVIKPNSMEEFFALLMDVLLVFAVPIIVLCIMYAGFLYVTSRGNPSKIEKAHRALLWSVVGGVIVLGARLIIGVIQTTVQTL